MRGFCAGDVTRSRPGTASSSALRVQPRAIALTVKSGAKAVQFSWYSRAHTLICGGADICYRTHTYPLLSCRNHAPIDLHEDMRRHAEVHICNVIQTMLTTTFGTVFRLNCTMRHLLSTHQCITFQPAS
jgi:hypothetical protein